MTVTVVCIVRWGVCKACVMWHGVLPSMNLYILHSPCSFGQMEPPRMLGCATTSCELAGANNSSRNGSAFIVPSSYPTPSILLAPLLCTVSSPRTLCTPRLTPPLSSRSLHALAAHPTPGCTLLLCASHCCACAPRYLKTRGLQLGHVARPQAALPRPPTTSYSFAGRYAGARRGGGVVRGCRC